MKILDGLQGRRCDEEEYLSYTHKICPQCEKTKLVKHFYKKNTQTKRGWAWDSKCIECRRSDCKVYGASNRSKRNKRLREWRRKNPEAARNKDRRARIKHKYGLTENEVEDMRRKQNDQCAICDVETSRLFIDHCHVSGKVRGLLCQPCNTLLGWYENNADQIVKFQEYLLKFG